MKILVIDDSPFQRLAAVNQLAATHDLTVVRGYDEAIKALSEAQFDVVLTDLMMPAGETNTSYKRGEQYADEIMGMGVLLVLRAAMADVKYIGLLSAGNHHDGAFPKFLDYTKPMHINGCQVMMNQEREFLGHNELAQATEKRWDKLLEKLINN